MRDLNPVTTVSYLYAKRELIRQFAIREIQANTRGSVVGAGWLVFDPLVKMGIYTFVFGFVFAARFGTNDAEPRGLFALTIFLGLSIFQLISDSLGQGPSTILRNPNLVKKVVFPTEILPVAAAAASLFRFGVSLGVFAVGAIIMGVEVNERIMVFPLVVIPVVLMAVGITWAVSAVGVYLRDVERITQLLSLVLLYGSAVFFPLHILPEKAQDILGFNPIVHALEGGRSMIIANAEIDIGGMVYLYCWALVVFSLGFAMFRKLKTGFADVL